MKKLKIGIVGVGFMGQLAHLAHYSALKKECEVVALAEIRPELAKLVAAKYGVPKTYSTHAEMIEKEELDGIAAIQTYRNHASLIPEILRAGIPVITEKPLCLTVEEGENLVRIGDGLGALHLIGNHKRSDPAMEYAKSVIESWKQTRECGDMRYIRITMPPGDWTAGADAPIYTDEPYPPVVQEGNPVGYDQEQSEKYDFFVNYYIHQVNAARYLLGESYRFVYADRKGQILVGESDSGVTVVIEMAPYNTSSEWHEEVLVGFDNGFVRIELPAPLATFPGKVTVMADNGDQPKYHRPILPNRPAMRQQAMNFLAAIRGEKPGPCTAREALEDLKVARDYVDFLSRTVKV